MSLDGATHSVSTIPKVFRKVTLMRGYGQCGMVFEILGRLVSCICVGIIVQVFVLSTNPEGAPHDSSVFFPMRPRPPLSPLPHQALV
jgi:hypothetical protein